MPSLTLSKGIEYFLSIAGDMMVILCRRKAAHVWALLGKKPENTKNYMSEQTFASNAVNFILISLTIEVLSCHINGFDPNIYKDGNGPP